MARKATGKTKSAGKPKARARSAPKSRAVGERRSSGGGRRSSDTTGEAFIKLLQSPFAAELVAVAATAALAALAEQGFSSRARDEGTTSKRAGRAVKEAGKAAAAAVGRRLTVEIDEIRKASKAKGGATK